MTLREISASQDHTEDLHRRWFSDHHLDLFVWENVDGECIKFQLCYQPPEEHAVTWDAEEGLQFHTVNDGERIRLNAQSPLLFKIEDDVDESSVISALLHGVRNERDVHIYDFILEKFREHRGAQSNPD